MAEPLWNHNHPPVVLKLMSCVTRALSIAQEERDGTTKEPLVTATSRHQALCANEPEGVHQEGQDQQQ